MTADRSGEYDTHALSLKKHDGLLHPNFQISRFPSIEELTQQKASVGLNQLLTSRAACNRRVVFVATAKNTRKAGKHTRRS